MRRSPGASRARRCPPASARETAPKLSPVRRSTWQRQTDSPFFAAEALEALAAALAAAGREAEANVAAGDALELYEAKGNVVAAERVRPLERRDVQRRRRGDGGREVGERGRPDQRRDPDEGRRLVDDDLVLVGVELPQPVDELGEPRSDGVRPSGSRCRRRRSARGSAPPAARSRDAARGTGSPRSSGSPPRPGRRRGRRTGSPRRRSRAASSPRSPPGALASSPRARQ